MALGKRPKRYHLRTGDRFAVTPKSGRRRFTVWPALLFVIVASIYYISTQKGDGDGALIAGQQNAPADRVVTGTLPEKK